MLSYHNAPPVRGDVMWSRPRFPESLTLAPADRSILVQIYTPKRAAQKKEASTSTRVSRITFKEASTSTQMVGCNASALASLEHIDEPGKRALLKGHSYAANPQIKHHLETVNASDGSGRVIFVYTNRELSLGKMRCITLLLLSRYQC